MDVSENKEKDRQREREREREREGWRETKRKKKKKRERERERVNKGLLDLMKLIVKGRKSHVLDVCTSRQCILQN